MWRFASTLLVTFVLSGCSVHQMVSRGLADALAVPESSGENDLVLVRDASPFYLKLAETVLRDNPDHLGLAIRVSSGFTQYSYAFVAQEADFLEATDPAQADALRQRARLLYQRAFKHAWAALVHVVPTLPGALADPDATNPLGAAHVELAYWTTAAWGGWISLSKDEPEVVADLPQAVRLAQWAWAVQGDFADGGLTSLLATFEAGRPSGSKARAAELFDVAIKQSGGLSVAILLAKAESVAQPAGDRVAFDHLLKRALSVQTPPGHPLTLSNAVALRRARWLQAHLDDLF